MNSKHVLRGWFFTHVLCTKSIAQISSLVVYHNKYVRFSALIFFENAFGKQAEFFHDTFKSTVLSNNEVK